MKQPPLQIRVPSDDDHGPNPYDSRTGLQTPRWLTLDFWITIVLMAIGLTAARYFSNGGHL